MKLFSKVLCILSVLVLCVPFFCLSVSAVKAYDVKLPSYYGIENFEPNEDGSGFKMKAEDIDENGLPTFFESNYLETGVTDNSKYSVKVEDNYMFKSPYSVVDGNAINCLDGYVMFTKSLQSAVKQNNMTMNTADEYYYFTFFYEYSQPYSANYDGYEYTKVKYTTCYTLLSTTPFSFYSNGTNIFIEGSSKFSKYFGGSMCHEWGVKIADGITFDHSSSGLGFYPTSRTSIKFDSNLNYIHGRSLEDWDVRLSKCYTNCDIDTSLLNSDENLVKGISSLKPENPADLISVTVEPDFCKDMNTNLLDDRWKFTVTNDSDKAIQFCAYINTSSDSDDDFITSDIINLGYSKAKWNYKVEADYYSIESTNEDKYGGLIVDTTLSPSKAHGTTVWVYVPPKSSYTDVVYWKNMNLARMHTYRLQFRAVYIPDGLDIVTNIFNTSWMSNPEHLDYLTDYRTTNSWLIINSAVFGQVGSEVIISDKMKNYEFQYHDIMNVYSQDFSFTYLPEFTGDSAGGQGIISHGFSDDVSEFSHKDVSYNLDTGKTTYNKNGNSNDFSFDIDNASVEDINGYLDYSKNFFSLIGATLQTFPTFIWGLIAFGLTAFVVIAIIKWIIT